MTSPRVDLRMHLTGSATMEGETREGLPSGCFSHSLRARMWWESEEEFAGWVFKNTKNLNDSVDVNQKHNPAKRSSWLLS